MSYSRISPPRFPANDTPGRNDFSRSFRIGRPVGRQIRHRLGRTLPESRLRRLPFGILFKMPTTTTGLSMNENEPARREPCRPVRGNRTPGKQGSDATSQKISGSPAGRQAPGKSGRFFPFLGLRRDSSNRRPTSFDGRSRHCDGNEDRSADRVASRRAVVARGAPRCVGRVG